MAIVSLNTIKNWFKTGLKPTQAQFWATWDSFRHKSDKVPFAEIDGLDAVLLAQNNKIDAIALPDSVIETGIVYINGLTADIIPEAFVWRLNQVNYLNALAFNDVMPASTDGYIRTDIFVGTNLGTIYRVQGPEAIGVAVKLPAPDGTVELAAVDIEGAVASDPVIANPNGDVLSVNGKKGDVVLNKVDVGLGNVDNTSDINKPISIAQQEALDLKLDATAYNQYFKGKFLTAAAMRAAFPTANVGDSAQVNEVGATTVVNYSWDDELVDWVVTGSVSGSAANTDELPEGTTNFYYTATRFIADLTLARIVAALGYTPSRAPNNAQKNSDITKAEIEAKLTGEITTHTHAAIAADPSQITITTTVSITTDTLGNAGKTQNGKNVIIDNGVNAINITVNGGTDFMASYLKHGTGAITFVQAAGRTLILVDATTGAVLNGAVGSTATISSVGTKDYLRISNAT